MDSFRKPETNILFHSRRLNFFLYKIGNKARLPTLTNTQLCTGVPTQSNKGKEKKKKRKNHSNAKNSKEFSKMLLETIRQILHDHIIQGQDMEINLFLYISNKQMEMEN